MNISSVSPAITPQVMTPSKPVNQTASENETVETKITADSRYPANLDENSESRTGTNIDFYA